jgi:hypothetical protein
MNRQQTVDARKNGKTSTTEHKLTTEMLMLVTGQNDSSLTPHQRQL